MAVKLEALELPKLLPWIEQHFPATFMVQEELKTHLMGSFPNLDFFVDQWPNPQAVVAAVDPKPEKDYGCLFDDEVIGLFGLNTDALASVLKAAFARFADRSQPKLFHCLTIGLLTTMKPLIAQAPEPQPLGTPCLLLKATSRDLKLVPVPDGMKISAVTDATVGIVNSTWKYTNPHTADHIRFAARHFPSVVMTTASGEHVGHMISSSLRFLGMLYVVPRFRRQGHAKVIITQLAQKCFDSTGEDVYVMVEESNPSSINLHLSLGFQPVTDSRFYFLHLALECGDWFK